MKNAFVSSNELKVENDIFDPFRGDMNLIVRELIKNMIDKDSEDGKIVATIEIKLLRTFSNDGATYQPMLKHKICSTLQLKDEMKGGNKTLSGCLSKMPITKIAISSFQKSRWRH